MGVQTGNETKEEGDSTTPRGPNVNETRSSEFPCFSQVGRVSF